VEGSGGIPGTTAVNFDPTSSNFGKVTTKGGGRWQWRAKYPDDGDVDMLKAMRVYKEVGFDGMMMPDHVPKVEGDANGYQAFAFPFGYIKALIAAVAAES
jgi:D-mannonate dehydratase